MELTILGWNPHFDQHFQQYRGTGMEPARVAREDRQVYTLYGQLGELSAEVSGKFRFNAQSKAAFPAVGDWVAIEPRLPERAATIQAVLPRKSAFSRKVAWTHTEEQILAANVDTVFLVSGLDNDFEPRRIERYLTLAWESGATPVIVLNKADLCADVEARRAEVEAIAFGVPIFSVSATERQGLHTLQRYLGLGQTVALLGSSGVGKSTLVNALVGAERQKVSAVREDDSQGRHTTTRRELVLLPEGAILVDTPGMRELQLWSDEEALGETFEDVESLARRCRFRDCTHHKEPGCAVQRALRDGSLDAGRYQNYVKLQKELRYLAIRQDQLASQVEKAKWKRVSQWQKRHQKQRG